MACKGRQGGDLDLLPGEGEYVWVDTLTRAEIQAFLSEETLFHGASPEAIERLSEVTRQKLVPKDCHLFSMGQPCDAMHFVVEGSALLVKTAPDGRQFTLHGAVRGDMVGCVPFFDRKPYPASFVAESDCLVVSLPRDELLKLFGEDPSVSLSVLGGIVGRLRTMASKLEQLSFEDTTHRLWEYLVNNSSGSRNGGYPRVLEPLPTREHIANQISTVREVVSRRLRRLIDSGHIEIEGRRLIILKPLE